MVIIQKLTKQKQMFALDKMHIHEYADLIQSYTKGADAKATAPIFG